MEVSGSSSLKEPHCYCKLPAKKLCVKKEGPTKGRWFYGCRKWRTEQAESLCQYFKWESEVTKRLSSADNSNNLGLPLTSQDFSTPHPKTRGTHGDHNNNNNNNNNIKTKEKNEEAEFWSWPAEELDQRNRTQIPGLSKDLRFSNPLPVQPNAYNDNSILNSNKYHLTSGKLNSPSNLNLSKYIKPMGWNVNRTERDSSSQDQNPEATALYIVRLQEKCVQLEFENTELKRQLIISTQNQNSKFQLESLESGNMSSRQRLEIIENEMQTSKQRQAQILSSPKPFRDESSAIIVQLESEIRCLRLNNEAKLDKFQAFEKESKGLLQECRNKMNFLEKDIIQLKRLLEEKKQEILTYKENEKGHLSKIDELKAEVLLSSDLGSLETLRKEKEFLEKEKAILIGNQKHDQEMISDLQAKNRQLMSKIEELQADLHGTSENDSITTNGCS
ncbi:hypothetical protein G9A89_012546 [Geosiphon pyriformis]|nr:hypothetical protein G9A89_012546 [Geosiphon pyriformis]